VEVRSTHLGHRPVEGGRLLLTADRRHRVSYAAEAKP
jgi:hypothetical protein